MLDNTNVSTVLTSAANLGSNSLLALSQLNFLSGSSNPFQNATTFSSSSSSGALYLDERVHIVTAGAGDDRIYAGSANDQVYGGGGNNTLYLGEGFNISVTCAGNDTIFGGSASDIVNAGKGNNTLYLGEGLNVAITGLGDDLIYGGAAADVIKAGDGNNTIYAGEGNNFVFTGTGNDLIHAGSGNDAIFSGKGNDTIYAGEGNNFISAGTGNDTVYAGSGSDRFELVTGEGSVSIISFGSNDKIHLGKGLLSKPLSFIAQNGDTLIKAGDDLLATLKWTQLSGVAIDTDSLPIDIQVVDNALDDGTSFSFTSIAKRLWDTEQFSNPQDLAGVLQKDGATVIQIAQAFNYGLDFNLETIANALDDGTTFDYTEISKGLWNSGKTDFNSQDLARVLQNEGATATEIAQAFNYGLEFNLETIATALDNGATFNYTDVAYALWNSGKTNFNSKDLARVCAIR